MVFRGKKFGARLVLLILLVTLFVIMLQMIAVNKISSNTARPWEAPDQRGDRRDLRTVHTLSDNNNNKQPAVHHVDNKESQRHDMINTQSPPTLKIDTSSLSQSSPPSSLSLSTLSSKDSFIDSKTQPPPPVMSCTLTSKDSLSALQRAKTDECKRILTNISCLAQESKLYDTTIKNSCPIGRNPTRQFKTIPYEKGEGPLPHVVFLMSIHGRAIRQVQRLFKTIYHADHFYYIHVDERSDYLYREVVRMISDYPNVYVPKLRFATIWGGSSLLTMLLQALEDLEYKLPHWKWDFFINLSESDYPLKTTEELVQFLRVHRHDNFVKTHGGDINRFIQKQGLDRTFVQCEGRMWRVANRNLPPDITIDGGSDWIAINRNYSHYLVTNKDHFLTGLKKYYEYSLLPAESFFHTVLRNGPLCSTMVRSNLRITNWNRKLGCLCQYKHIVDWCGCSPNDFLPKDLNRLKDPGAQNFFARKFEAIVNQQIINEIHSHVFGPYDSTTTSLSSYWQNVYHNEDILSRPSSGQFTTYQSFMRIGLKKLNKLRNESTCPTPPGHPFVKEVHVFYREDHYVGHLIKLQDSDSLTNPLFELLVMPKSVFEVQDQSEELSKRITAIEVGSQWDGKESIFRNYGNILGVHDTPVIALRLMVGIMGHVTVVWQNPIGITVEQHDIKLDPNLVVTFNKLKSDKPLMPGVWKVWIEINKKIYMIQNFLITPIAYDKDMLLNDPVSVNAKRMNHDIVNHKSDEIVSRYKEWCHNVVKTGVELNDWIDHLTQQFWEIKSICCTGGNTNCKAIPSCEELYWSSLYSDQKSELGPVQTDGRIS